MEEHIKFIGKNWAVFLTNDFLPLLRNENSTIKILETNQNDFIGYYWLLSKEWTENKFKIMDAIFLNSVIIDLPFQKQGYGPLILEEVKKHMRLVSGSSILAYVQKSNEVSYHFFVDKNKFNVIKKDDKNWMIQLGF